MTPLRHVPIVLALSFLLSGGLTQATEDTAAHHGIELPDGVAAVLPLPSGIDAANSRKVMNTYYVNFRFELPWTEVLEFFSTHLAQDGWTIERELLPESQSGPPTAGWEASGHGVTLRLDLERSLRVAGEPESGVGVLQVRPIDD